MFRYCCLATVVVWGLAGGVTAAETDAQALTKQVVDAAGGADKLLKLFRMKERLAVSADPNAKGSERVSVVEAPKNWWIGTKDRGEEPAKTLVWAWSLGILVDPKSKIEVLPDVVDADQPLFGLRMSGTVDPPLDMYFDKKSSRLVRIDWRQDIHRFSDWREHDGVRYPAKCSGYKKATAKLWYFTEILELERLKELPPGLSR